MPTKCPHSSHRRTCSTRHQPGFSARPTFHGGAESRRQMREQRDLTSPQMPHVKTHCVSMQPPPQSGVLLFAKHNHLAPHSFTGYQPLISGCRVYRTTSHSHYNSPSSAATVCRGHFSNSHDNSPSSAAAVCRGHFLIHMITAPHQRLPCRGLRSLTHSRR